MVSGSLFVVACFAGLGPHDNAPEPKTDVLGYGRGGAVRVTCSDEDDCNELAAQTCPGGYEVGARDDSPALYVSTPSRTTFIPGPKGGGTHVTTGGGTVLAAPEKHELFVDCHTREEAKPSWERAKRDKGYGELAARVAAPAPSSLAGFPLEGELEAARSRCADAHQEWKDVRDGQGECSGTPTSVKFAAKTKVFGCGTEHTVCSIEAIGAPDGPPAASDRWISVLGSLRAELEDRYGKPTGITRQWPAECRGDALLDCLSNGKARFSFRWHWDDGHSIALTLSRAGSIPAFRIRYSTPLYRQTRKPASSAADGL
jgi:hypothetical protein